MNRPIALHEFDPEEYRNRGCSFSLEELVKEGKEITSAAPPISPKL